MRTIEKRALSMHQVSRSVVKTLSIPLVQFFLIGAVLFCSYSLLGGEALRGDSRDKLSDKIHIKQTEVRRLAEAFQVRWDREPSPVELEGMLENLVREQVFLREALKIGLDKNQDLVEHCLATEFSAAAYSPPAALNPSDAQLRLFMADNPDLYAAPAQLSFRQVYLFPGSPEELAPGDLTQLLAQLNRAGTDVDLSSINAAPDIEITHLNVTPGEIRRDFGPDFLARLVTLTPDRWQGPVASTQGLHLVQLTDKTRARLPALADIRDRVAREWEIAFNRQGYTRWYQSLRAGYDIHIDQVPQ